MDTKDFASFGAVHLNITNLQKCIEFWTNVVGLKQLNETEYSSELGTETKTLVVLHESATKSFVEGYSGLYHFAIHAPNKDEFAKMVQRLVNNKYPFSPTDHTLSKAVYLIDPDEITIEITLETPERYKGMIIRNGYWVEDVDGTLRSPSDILDLSPMLRDLTGKTVDGIVHQETYIGHLHFYASDLDATNEFYKELGFTQFNYGRQIMFADLGMNGPFKHRIAMNTWHGRDKPRAPSENAGLLRYDLIFHSKENLDNVVGKFQNVKKEDAGYLLTDPTGNLICLKTTSTIIGQ